MKTKLLLFAIAISTLTGCAAALHNTYSIGMSEEEFKDKNVGEKLMEMSEARTVYRLQQTNGAYQFVYFRDGKIYKVDEGVRSPDLVIENR